MFGRKKRIRIEFFDAETGQMIGFDEKKPKQIPPSFQFDTKVKIRGKTWKLVSAEPFARKEYLRAGTIKIILEAISDNGDGKSTPIDSPVRESLHKTPSRAATYPEFSGKRKGADLLELASWEWRQIELVASRHRNEISRELELSESTRKKSATTQEDRTLYRQQHIRNLSEESLLPSELSSTEMRKEFFPFATTLDGLTMMGETGIAEKGFAFRLPAGLTFYGLDDPRNLQCLGLLPPKEEHHLIAVKDLQRLVNFMEARELVLIDWNQGRFVEPILPALADYFGLDVPKEDKKAASPAESTDATAIVDATEESAPVDAPEPSDENGKGEQLFTASSAINTPEGLADSESNDDEELLDMRIDHGFDPDSEEE